jgi:hypothetical protein
MSDAAAPQEYHATVPKTRRPSTNRDVPEAVPIVVGVALSPDKQSLLLPLIESIGSNLRVVDNFR